jgi:hypothetical protein
MLNIYEIESDIIADVKPHIIFSTFILRNAILHDIVSVMTEKMFYLYEDVAAFYAERSKIIMMNLGAITGCMINSADELRYDKYGLTTEQKWLIVYHLSMGFRDNGILDLVKMPELPPDYVAPDFCEINISREGNKRMIEDAKKFEHMIKNLNDVYRTITKINKKYLEKYAKSMTIDEFIELINRNHAQK